MATVEVKGVLTLCSASSDLTVSVSSNLEDEDLQQLRVTMKKTLANLTRFVRCFALATQ